MGGSPPSRAAWTRHIVRLRLRGSSGLLLQLPRSLACDVGGRPAGPLAPAPACAAGRRAAPTCAAVCPPPLRLAEPKEPAACPAGCGLQGTRERPRFDEGAARQHEVHQGWVQAVGVGGWCGCWDACGAARACCGRERRSAEGGCRCCCAGGGEHDAQAGVGEAAKLRRRESNVPRLSASLCLFVAGVPCAQPPDRGGARCLPTHPLFARLPPRVPARRSRRH